jgi:hypothetical protein
MAARLTQKTVNDELTRLGHHARLEKATGYHYFYGGEAADWRLALCAVKSARQI